MMLDNPSMMDSLLQNNPAMSGAMQNNPEMRDAFRNPAVREMMKDPTFINSVVGMMSRVNNSGAGTMEGNEQSFPRPGVVTPEVNYEELYKSELADLEEMGFPNKSECIEALKAHNGNVEKAFEMLFNNKK